MHNYSHKVMHKYTKRCINIQNLRSIFRIKNATHVLCATRGKRKETPMNQGFQPFFAFFFCVAFSVSKMLRLLRILHNFSEFINNL